MNLSELHTTISATTCEDWNRITSYSGAPIDISGAFDHTDLLVLRADLDVSVAYGMPVSAEPAHHQVQPPWALDHWTLTFTFADLRYRGQLVDRLRMVDVNGLGRAILPVAETVPTCEQPRCSQVHHDLALRLHMSVYGDFGSFDHHWRASGIVVGG